MTAWTLYWLMKLDDIVCVFGVTFAVGAIFIGVGVIVSLIAMAAEDTSFDEIKKMWGKGKWLLILWVVSIIFATFIPTTKQMAALIVVPKVVNAVQQHEGLKQIPNKIIDLGNEWLEELGPEKRKEK